MEDHPVVLGQGLDVCIRQLAGQQAALLDGAYSRLLRLLEAVLQYPILLLT